MTVPRDRRPARSRMRAWVVLAALAVVGGAFALTGGGGGGGGSLFDRLVGILGAGDSLGSGVGGAGTGGEDGIASATVERVVDGDTVIVDYRGDRTRIRLLNIDTPESVDPDRPAECLGVEASEFLADVLPPGTEVRLGFDDEREDQYGRLLAAVFLDDGTLVNAEIARAGLGESVVFGGNDRYLAAVRDAEADAVDAGVGLHAADLRCS